MKNNSPFVNKDNEIFWLKECSDNFKNRTLFFNLQEKLTVLLKNVKNNTEFRSFLQDRKKHKNFTYFFKFYTSYLSDKLFTRSIQDFMDKFVSFYIKEILLKGYLEKSDYDNFIKSGVYEELNKEEIEDYISTLFSQWEKDEAKKSIEVYEKILTDFDFLKKEIFLDYTTEDKNKIIVNIEWLFSYFQMYDGHFLDEEDMSIGILIHEVGSLFTRNVTENASVVKKFQELVRSYFGKKYTKTEIFYFVIYNKIINNNSDNLLEIAKKYFGNLLKKGYLKKKVGAIYEVLSKNIFESVEYSFLWKHNIIYTTDDFFSEMLITKDFYEFFYEGQEKIKIEEASENNLENLDIISHNIYENKIKDKNIKITKYFFETSNVVKRNIPIKSADIKNYKSIYKYCKKGVSDFIQNFLHQDYDDYTFYEVLLPGLYKASKKLITANFYNRADFGISSDFQKLFNDFSKKYRNKFIKIDDFIDLFFEESLETYGLFQRISKYLSVGLSNKITDYEMKKYFFSEKQLFKRLLEYLAKIGYLDIAGKTLNKKIIYNSGSGGYGWGSYELYENEVEVEVFEGKYLRFKDLQIDTEFSENNHISGQEIYLSLNTPLKAIEQFSKFTILKKLENYIILDISRDSLIKAKNTYNLDSKNIEKTFLEINIDLPKNIQILLKSIDNQKNDASILPIGIPVFIENMGLFQEFNKLKMFNKYILFSDEEKKLIIFSTKFSGLENLLNKRKILFDKKEK